MLNRIEQWIDETNAMYEEQRVCCSKYAKEFEGFYPLSFLNQAYFVVVDQIPKPDFPGLREMGLGDFIDLDVDGITYKNTYYVLPHAASNLRLHFHELVHVVQWMHLGAIPFIERYINEINVHGYDEAPLEQMAYGFDSHFSKGGVKIDVLNYVAQKI